MLRFGNSGGFGREFGFLAELANRSRKGDRFWNKLTELRISNRRIVNARVDLVVSQLYLHVVRIVAYELGVPATPVLIRVIQGPAFCRDPVV